MRRRLLRWIIGADLSPYLTILLDNIKLRSQLIEEVDKREKVLKENKTVLEECDNIADMARSLMNYTKYLEAKLQELTENHE